MMIIALIDTHAACRHASHSAQLARHAEAYPQHTPVTSQHHNTRASRHGHMQKLENFQTASLSLSLFSPFRSLPQISCNNGLFLKLLWFKPIGSSHSLTFSLQVQGQGYND